VLAARVVDAAPVFPAAVGAGARDHLDAAGGAGGGEAAWNGDLLFERDNASRSNGLLLLNDAGLPTLMLGASWNGKVAARFEIVKGFAIRGASM